MHCTSCKHLSFFEAGPSTICFKTCQYFGSTCYPLVMHLLPQSDTVPIKAHLFPDTFILRWKFVFSPPLIGEKSVLRRFGFSQAVSGQFYCSYTYWPEFICILSSWLRRDKLPAPIFIPKWISGSVWNKPIIAPFLDDLKEKCSEIWFGESDLSPSPKYGIQFLSDSFVDQQIVICNDPQV